MEKLLENHARFKTTVKEYVFPNLLPIRFTQSSHDFISVSSSGEAYLERYAKLFLEKPERSVSRSQAPIQSLKLTK